MIRQRSAGTAASIVIGLWLLLYEWRAVANFLALGTNAYDLSVFDYAVWDLARGGTGFVPFFGHSIFSEHFMPVLYALVPLYWASASSIVLVILQPVLAAAAAAVFYRILVTRDIPSWLALALLLLFLFARRTNGALGGFFYPEVFQTVLTFAVVLMWTGHPVVLTALVIALLTTKEDAAIYLAGFAVFALSTHLGSRRRGIVLLVASIGWFVAALTIVIPASRRHDGLGTSNPLLQARYGSQSDRSSVLTMAEHVFSGKTVSTIANLAISTGFLPFAGPVWMLPALPGIAANLAASPDSMQSGLIQHYAWPILPWLFLSTAAGAAWLNKRSPRAARIWMGVVLLATLADNPAIQRFFGNSVPPEAAVVREQLRDVHASTILTHAGLLPYMDRSTSIFLLGGPIKPSREPELVVLSIVGNPWPLTNDDVSQLVTKYRSDPRYIKVKSGPLFVFRRVGGS